MRAKIEIIWWPIFKWESWWPFFKFQRFDFNKTALACTYKWVVDIGPLEIDRLNYHS